MPFARPGRTVIVSAMSTAIERITIATKPASTARTRRATNPALDIRFPLGRHDPAAIPFLSVSPSLTVLKGGGYGARGSRRDFGAGARNLRSASSSVGLSNQSLSVARVAHGRNVRPQRREHGVRRMHRVLSRER